MIQKGCGDATVMALPGAVEGSADIRPLRVFLGEEGVVWFPVPDFLLHLHVCPWRGEKKSLLL